MKLFFGQLTVTLGVVFVVFLNRVVAQMNALLRGIQIELLSTESQVAIFVHPDCQRVKISNQEPIFKEKLFF